MTGTRALVALLHGGGTTAAQWDLVPPLLGAPVVAPDVPGRAGRARHQPDLSAAVDSVAAILDGEAAAAG